jgi:predicted GIY-YIG superfamily endonuclease
LHAIVYLLHLDPPYKHARHYVGWTGRPLDERLAEHQTGKRRPEGHGAALLAAQIARGGTWIVARTWAFTGRNARIRARERERRIKHKSATRFCPICQQKAKVPPNDRM